MKSTISHHLKVRRPSIAAGAVVLFALLSAGAAPASATSLGSGFGDQWALENSGQFAGSAGDDIDIQGAWAIEDGGNASVIVGAVDSGVNFSHEGLEHANLYTQHAASDSYDTPCKAALYGCDFVAEGATPSDQNGHGTATAGVIAAGGADGPYTGIAPNSTLIVARVLDSANRGEGKLLAAGLNYVADRGARVVNVSISGSRSTLVHEAIASHPQTLFVVAAGNSGVNVDGSASDATYPCVDPAANVICVAASDSSDKLASFSNYGSTSVDLAAPGKNIATLTIEGDSDGWYGTSFAAPMVTGTAALAFALRPAATAAQVKKAILESVDARPELAGKTVTGGRLNADAALLALQRMLPAAPPALTTAPSITGDASTPGEKLTAGGGVWSGAPTSTSIAWERCDKDGGHCQLIAGASGSTYIVQGADAEHTLRAQLTATNAAGSEIAYTAAIPKQVSAEAPVSPAAGSTTIISHVTATATVRSVSAIATATKSAASRRAIHLTASTARAPRSVRLSLTSTVGIVQIVTITVHWGSHETHMRIPLGAEAEQSLTIHLAHIDTSRRAKISVSSTATTAVESASVLLKRR